MKSDTLIRKDVHLAKGTVKNLKSLAEADGRTLKNYMEKVLLSESMKISVPSELIGKLKKH